MNKECYLKLIDLLYTSVLAEGGDGDAMWYVKYTTIEDIMGLIEEYSKTKTYYNWKIQHEKNYILWGDNQEWVVITNDLDIWNRSPDYSTLKVMY